MSFDRPIMPTMLGRQTPLTHLPILSFSRRPQDYNGFAERLVCHALNVISATLFGAGRLTARDEELY
jgi:hypothetical protein